MMFGLGSISLSDVLYGTLNAGIVPHGRLFRTTAWDRNLAPVTVLAGLTDVVLGTSVTVANGDLILIYGYLIMVKGGTPGSSAARLLKHGGTAIIVFLNNRPSVSQIEPAHPAGTTWEASIGSMIRVSGGGTLVMKLESSSGDSNGTVGIGAGQIGVWVLHGS